MSTTIRDDNDRSFDLTNRGNMVAVVSDSTRVLGDGDCTPAGGLGVMEGKAFLMKYLGGIDAVPLCIDSRDPEGRNDPDRIIEFVKMVQHSFGAVNLEDISQPNCFKVLDVLREACDIPVWHDDAQGTACVTLAGVLNAIKLAGKKLGDIRIVLIGAGASNTTIARLLIRDGADPSRMVMFDTRGSLNRNRKDIEADPRFYRKWELCTSTNASCVATVPDAFAGSGSRDRPVHARARCDQEAVGLLHGREIHSLLLRQPRPGNLPLRGKRGRRIHRGNRRGDFPNQVNNSIGFPGILKGTLIVRARKITDEMAIAAAHSLAGYAEKRGISPDSIVPTMDETGVFAEEAADVAMQAIRDGVARVTMSREEVRAIAARDIQSARDSAAALMDAGLIPAPDQALLQEDFQWACDASGE